MKLIIPILFLSVNLWAGNGSFNVFVPGGSGGLSSITTDATLIGSGTLASPLSAISANIETLSGSKTLDENAKTNQILNCNGANRDVILSSSTAMVVGTKFHITNNTNTDHKITVKYADGTEIDYIGPFQNSKTYQYTASGVWLPLFGNSGNGSMSWGYKVNPHAGILTIGPEAKGGTGGRSVVISATFGAGDGPYVSDDGYASAYYGMYSYGARFGAGFGYNSRVYTTYGKAFGSGSASQNMNQLAINFDHDYSNGWTHRMTDEFHHTSTASVFTEALLWWNHPAFYPTYRYVIPASTIVSFTAYCVARSTDAATNVGWVAEYKGAIRRDNANNTSLVGSVTSTLIAADAGASGWDVQFSADDTNESLKCEVKGTDSYHVAFACQVEAVWLTPSGPGRT